MAKWVMFFLVITFTKAKYVLSTKCLTLRKMLQIDDATIHAASLQRYSGKKNQTAIVFVIWKYKNSFKLISSKLKKKMFYIMSRKTRLSHIGKKCIVYIVK